jgi:hypothetical protein
MGTSTNVNRVNKFSFNSQGNNAGILGFTGLHHHFVCTFLRRTNTIFECLNVANINYPPGATTGMPEAIIVCLSFEHHIKQIIPDAKVQIRFHFL